MQLKISAANEKCIESKAGALCAEIARQETILSSVQHIERLVSKFNQIDLEDYAQVLASFDQLKGKIADLERIVKDLTDQKEAATVSAAEATLECSKLNLKVQELTLELAKMKLGDVTINTSAEEALEAKVALLTAELASTKFELTKAQTQKELEMKLNHEL